MATIYQRGRTWWIYTSQHGDRDRRSLGTKDERIARQKLRKYEYDAAAGQVALPSATPIGPFLAQFCTHLKTIRREGKSYKNDISYLRTIFGPACPTLVAKKAARRRRPGRRITVRDRLVDCTISVNSLEELTTAKIDAHISMRIRNHRIGPKTANRIREILHVMFNYAIRQHGFRSPDSRFPNPVAAVPRRKESDPEIRFLTLNEIDEQLRVLEPFPQLQTMVAVYIYAGLRREEALWLTHQDVALDADMIRVQHKTVAGETWRPKTCKNRRVPISTALRRHLDAYERPTSGPWYFPSPQGMRWDPDNFSEKLRTINREHDLPWSCLDFRHTFGSHLAMKGESLYKISELLGNSPEICRRHYAALIPEQMRDTVEFDRRVQGPRLRMA